MQVLKDEVLFKIRHFPLQFVTEVLFILFNETFILNEKQYSWKVKVLISQLSFYSDPMSVDLKTLNLRFSVIL